jgi:hypothetical protein
MSTSEDHEGLADKLEQESEALKRESDKLGQEISDTRSDWEAKRNDPSVAGAPPPPDDDDGGGGAEGDRAGSGEPDASGSGDQAA